MKFKNRLLNFFLFANISLVSFGVGAADIYHGTIPDENPPWAACSVDLISSKNIGKKVKLRNVPLARTDEQRKGGLRKHKNDSPALMLFAWPKKRSYSMWMKDVDLPLSVAFTTGDSHIMNIHNMEPNTEHKYYSSKKTKVALETPSNILSVFRKGDRILIKDCKIVE